MDSPFQYGTLATDKNFIDRVAERAELKQMLSFVDPVFILGFHKE